MQPILADATAALGDFRRYPGCRVMLVCGFCAWSKAYNPERVIDRLHDLKAGGYATRLVDVARRVGWNCPGCRRMGWRAQFAWPPGFTPGEARRLADRYRH